MKRFLILSLSIVLGIAPVVCSQTVYTNQSISAQAEIYGAGNSGLPDGSGVLPPEYNLPAGATVLTMISVTGLITLNSGSGHNDPDGTVVSGWYYGPTISGASGYSVATAYGGISGVTIPGAGGLVGVFEPGYAPTGAPPASLNFSSSGIGSGFASLSPVLFQTFFVGDGLTEDGSGAVQQFIVPVGATRPLLGISDAPGFDGSPGAYNDNSGAFTASFQISSLALLSPQVSGGNFVFSFQSVANQNYLLESTTNLASGIWVTNVQLIGDGSLQQIPVSPTNAMAFFRLVEP